MILVLLGLVAALGLAGVVALRLPAASPPPPLPPCDLDQGACRVALEGNRVVEVTISPRPIPQVSPITVEARFSRGAASKVVLTATSETMDMGVTSIPLAQGEGEAYVGRGSLPVCGVESLRWRAQLDFELDGAARRAVMRFSTTHRNPELTPAGEGVERLDAPVTDFTLHTATGPFRLSDFRGKVVLLYFGYTFCPDICPTSLAATARALNQLTPADLQRVKTVFISVDPARDTPAHLAEYAHFFHPSMLGATGSDEEVAAAARPYGVVYARHEVSGASGYVVDHSAFTYLVAPDGHLAARLPHAAPARVVLAELARWLPDVDLIAGAVPSK